MTDAALFTFTVAAFVVGAAVGSFLNVCIWRLATERSIIWPSSHCPTCLSPIRWYDNIPILAQLVWLKGRCRDCGQAVSLSYAAGEFAVGVLFAVTFWLYFGEGLRDGLHGWPHLADGFPASAILLAMHFYLLSSLWTGSMIDIQYQIIPAGVTDVGIFIGLACSAAYPPLHLHAPLPAGDTVVAMGWGAAGGWVATWLLGRFGLWEALTPFPDPAETSPRQPIHAEPDDDADDMSDEDYAQYRSDVRKQALVELLQFAPVILGAFLAAKLCTSVPAAEWFRSLGTGLWGLTVGAGIVWTTRILGSWILAKEAMGLGDVYLMAMVGAFLGWQHALLTFFAAPFLGILFVVALRNRKIAFGPSLSLAAYAVMLTYRCCGGPYLQQFIDIFS